VKQKELDRPLMHLFVHIGKLLEDRFRSVLSEKGIHVGQARIFSALLDHEKLTQKEIAIGLHIKPSTVTNMVKRMEMSGLINRSRDKSDDRVINVTLTENGKEAARFTEKMIEQIEADIRAEFSREEVEALRKPLEKILTTLGGQGPSF
jgi:DNA-binding MarR family transcriptional regulator